VALETAPFAHFQWNFIGLKLACDAVSGDRAQEEGVRGGWAVYTSDEHHITLKCPDAGIIAIMAGRTDPEGARSGVARFVDDPAIAEPICEPCALTIKRHPDTGACGQTARARRRTGRANYRL
jgi:hypothetical protein